MKKVGQVSLVSILISIIIFSFWVQVAVALKDLPIVSPNASIAYINWFENSEIIASSLLSDAQPQIHLQAGIEHRKNWIQTMLRESEKFKFTSCGESTLCYLNLQNYAKEINNINQTISSLSSKNLVGQDGIDGLIDPRINPDGTLAEYQNNRDRALLHRQLIANKLQGRHPINLVPELF